MGTFHEVTTSTIDRGNSMLRGLDTVISLESIRATSALYTYIWVKKLIKRVKCSPFTI